MSKLWPGTIALFLCAIIALIMGGVLPAHAEDPADLETLAGVIRNTGSGFELLDDAGHTPINLASVTQTSTYIRVYYTDPIDQVGAVVIGSDETMADYHVECGASVGLEYLVIKCFRDGALLNPANMTWTNSNLWILGTVWD